MRSSLTLKLFIDRFDKPLGSNRLMIDVSRKASAFSLFQAGSVSAIMSSVMRATSNAQSRQTA